MPSLSPADFGGFSGGDKYLLCPSSESYMLHESGALCEVQPPSMPNGVHVTTQLVGTQELTEETRSCYTVDLELLYCGFCICVCNLLEDEELHVGPIFRLISRVPVRTCAG